ncbi:MAG: HPr family phosphocarrier protein [Cellulosilyticaceae bacterium]
MKQLTVIVKAESGLHARPAGVVAKTAATFASTITLEKDGKTADAKRLLNILSLAAKEGDSILITANGADEEQAVEAIKNVIEAE